MEKPHVVLLPFRGQGHINPMLNLAKLLHSKGTYITFVNTESSHKSILSSGGLDALNGLEDFKFEIIPDGISSNNGKSTQNVVKWCASSFENCAPSFREILVRLTNSTNVPRVTCIIFNWLMSFSLDVAKDLGIPALVFCTMSACGFIGSLHLEELIQRGYIPLKDKSYLTNGYLDTPIDWIPGMKAIRLRDVSSFVKTTDREEHFLNYENYNSQKSLEADGLILNTFDYLESEALIALKGMFPKVYTIGPLHVLPNQVKDSLWKSMKLSLWEEDKGYMQWLNAQKPSSVTYISTGSLVTLTIDQLTEFAWGLANSGHPFLWIIRPDLVVGEDTNLPEDFIVQIKGRGYIANWCAQEAVLSHPSVGGFLTHTGWNSTIESIYSGVPMICWPSFADQMTNCRYVCKEWEIGMELDEEVTREQVASIVKELMEGERGKEMRKSAMKWKDRAVDAVKQGGSSFEKLDELTKGFKPRKI